MTVWAFDAIGTRWEIETESPLDVHERAAVSAVIDDFDRTWSRFRADSLVSSLARSGGEVPGPADAVAMLDAYRMLSEATGGAVNPLVGESLSALGYDATVSLIAGAARPAPADWRGILTWSDARVSLAAPALIDVGAIGKGRLVDLVLAELAGVAGGVIVDAGGDIAVRGAEVRIGLEHPFDLTKAIGVASIRDQALCASAVNRRAWGDGLHHVLDGRTGRPVRTAVATWVLAGTTMLADALATALFFVPGAELQRAFDFSWLTVFSDGSAAHSAEFEGTLFT